MKYSLRSLMIGITLLCVLLGGRIEYLRRMASFHEREANCYIQSFASANERVALAAVRDSVLSDEYDPFYANDTLYRHSYLAQEYRRAVYRPWTIVNEHP
jgi:hypothetical protein